jgi:hypothetical protein
VVCSKIGANTCIYSELSKGVLVVKGDAVTMPGGINILTPYGVRWPWNPSLFDPTLGRVSPNWWTGIQGGYSDRMCSLAWLVGHSILVMILGSPQIKLSWNQCARLLKCVFPSLCHGLSLFGTRAKLGAPLGRPPMLPFCSCVPEMSHLPNTSGAHYWKTKYYYDVGTFTFTNMLCQTDHLVSINKLPQACPLLASKD